MKDNSREVSSSSTHTTRFTCAYCNNIINRSDTQCPYCGAETASSIKKYMEIKKAEAEQCNTRINGLDKKRKHCIIGLVCTLFAVVILSVLLFRFVGQSTVKTIIFTVLILAYAVYLVTGIKGIIKNYDERIDIPTEGLKAWGYVEYEKPLTEKQASDYELKPAVKVETREKSAENSSHDRRSVLADLNAKKALVSGSKIPKEMKNKSKEEQL